LNLSQDRLAVDWDGKLLPDQEEKGHDREHGDHEVPRIELRGHHTGEDEKKGFQR
jgi:hypothetical protein